MIPSLLLFASFLSIGMASMKVSSYIGSLIQLVVFSEEMNPLKFSLCFIDTGIPTGAACPEKELKLKL